MPTTTTYGFRYPAATDAPDGPGAFFNLASDLEGTLVTGSWAPAIGGAGATLGSTGGTVGKYFRIGTHWWLTGKMFFGTGGSFGTDVATITNLPVPMDQDELIGTGWWEQSSSFILPYSLRPATSQSVQIRTHAVSGSNVVLASANTSTLGNPPQSSVLKFQIRAVAA